MGIETTAGVQVAKALHEVRRRQKALQGYPAAWCGDDLSQAEQRLAEAVAEWSPEIEALASTTEQLYAELQAVSDREAERRARHVDIHKSLVALPQLFIAV